MQNQFSPAAPGFDLTNLEYVDCVKCGHDVFEQKIKIKKISAFVSPDGQEKLAITPIFVCSKCQTEFGIPQINEGLT